MRQFYSRVFCLARVGLGKQLRARIALWFCALVALIITFPTAAQAETARTALSILETKQAIVVKLGDQSVLTYNKVSPPAPAGMDKVYERSGFLHPVTSPNGRTVTAMFPADHPHQHGIFSAWVKTTYDGRTVDFWNLAGRTGRVLHERVISIADQPAKDGTVSFVVDLLHRAEPKTPKASKTRTSQKSTANSTKSVQPGKPGKANKSINILRERWHITVHPAESGHHRFDLSLTQTALTDKPLVIQKYRYGGVALRGPMAWLSPDDRKGRELLQRDGSAMKLEPSVFLNDLGSDRVKGNHERARWVAMSGAIDGKPATITVLCHPDNFRSPQAARLHPTKPYFCFAPCVNGAFKIDRKNPYRATYRYLITDTKPDAAWINKQWDEWVVETSRE